MSDRQALIRATWDHLFYAYLEQRFDRVLPKTVCHYTTICGLRAILRSRVLYLMAQPPEDGEGDQYEISWGRGEIVEEARKVTREVAFPGLVRMLDDGSASLFGRENESFVACFTTDENQWEKRGDAALIFDSAKLNLHHRTTLEGHGLARVVYGSEALRAAVASLLRAAHTGLALLGVLDQEEERLLAQHLMDIDVLSFFAKRQHLHWEAEWRLVKRRWVAGERIKANPRRLELSLDAPQCGLVGIVLKPGTILDGEVRKLVSAMAYSIPVTAS